MLQASGCLYRVMWMVFPDHNDPKFLGKQVFANSVDQILKEWSDQGILFAILPAPFGHISRYM